MTRLLPAMLILVCLTEVSAGDVAMGRCIRYYPWWRLPIYAVVGLPRDAIDAPCKALSSVPVVNRMLIVPLGLANTATAVTSWSFTEDGIEGGIEAWLACEGLGRMKDGQPPQWLRDRPWWRNYFPNLRTFALDPWQW